MYRLIGTNIKHLMNRKSVWITFYILLFLVLFNFWRNVIKYQGLDVVNMYHPMKLLALSHNLMNENADGVLLLIQLYPFLIVLPSGFSILQEMKTGEYIYMSSRIGRTRYIWSKTIAAFIVTTFVFMIPFLVEFVLNCISFPLAATGDLSNWSLYDENIVQYTKTYLFYKLYVLHPFLYTFLGIVVFGIASGLLGAAIVVLSTLIKIKYDVFLFIPSIFVLSFSIYMTKEYGTSYRWYDYLLLFSESEKSIQYFGYSVAVIFCFIIVGAWARSRRDMI